MIGTPIGNLEDITYRAVRVLGEVDLIACEDTRQTHKLMEHFGISKPTVSYHEHNEAERGAELVERIQQGVSVALVTDAGTPLVSDPGYRLVRAAVEAGIPVVPVPGASAAIAALSASGLPTDSFRFCGFFPAKSGQRRRVLESLRNETATLVFYEAPHRIIEALEDIGEALGDRQVVVARELTKMHEEFLRGTPADIAAELGSRQAVKGEMTVLIAKADRPEEPECSVRESVEALERAGVSRMDAMKQVARERGVSKRDVYREMEQ